MFELTINGNVYRFNFGIGFVREINKKRTRTVEGQTQECGLQFAVASLIDEDPLELVNILDLANKGENPRVTRALLDAYIDDENTDIDSLFAEVLDFFASHNATKKTTDAVQKMVEEQKAKAAQNQ